MKCNSFKFFCKFLVDVLFLVVWGDKIYFDGINIKYNLYICMFMMLLYLGICLNLNISLFFIG